MNLIRATRAAAAACLMSLAAGSAQAAMVNFSLTGTLDGSFIDVPNDFGLLFGSTITLAGTFDDSVLVNATPGSETGTVLFDDANPGNTFSITGGVNGPGTSVFTVFNTQDIAYTNSKPEMILSGGSLTTLNIAIEFGSFSFLDSFTDAVPSNAFEIGDDSGNFMDGHWGDITISAVVPVPAAAWLFGSGLIGLVGVLRRNRGRI